MQTLLEWAVENIVVWDDKWTHLRCGLGEVLFTSGGSWYNDNQNAWLMEDVDDPYAVLVEDLELGISVISKQGWLDAKEATITKEPSLKLSLEEVSKDAEEWGEVLNSCGWEASDIWRRHFGEVTTPRQFNNVKGFVREIIIHYLTEVYKDDTTPLLEEIATKKKELAELESKLKESKRG